MKISSSITDLLIIQNLVCGGLINATSHGTIIYPSKPGKYPINTDCEWQLIAPLGKRIQFLFNLLQIESHEHCNFDFLEFYSGLGTHSESIAKFCTSMDPLPAPIDSPGHVATVFFHADEVSNDAGFMIAYTLMPAVAGCGGSYVNPSGSISSPKGNNEEGHYDHGMVCEFEIRMPLNARIKIDFVQFKLEPGSMKCPHDKVEVNFH